MIAIKTQKILIILAFILLVGTAVSYMTFYKGISDTTVLQDQVENVPTSTIPEMENTPTHVPQKPQSTPTTVPKKLKITAAGDILLGRGVGTRLINKNLNYTHPFTDVAPILKKGDIVFGNLEESITGSTHSLKNINEGGKYVLKNNPEAIEGIKYAGFNLLNLANNHILDFYEKGMLDTLSVLDANGIHYSGVGKNLSEARKPAIIEKCGYRVALLSYTDMSEVTYLGNPSINFIATHERYGVAPRKLEYILEDINSIKGKVDLILVSLHWGIEESFEVPKDQVEFAHKILDNGADAILGHHPHQFHGIEIYNGKPIIYSMGNLIFDQNDPENQESFILTMEYEENKLVSFNAIPTRVENKIKITLPKGKDAIDLLNRQKGLCEQLGTTPSINGDMLEFSIN